MALFNNQIQQGTQVTSDSQATATGKYYKRYYACTVSSGSNVLTTLALQSDTYRSSSNADKHLDFDLTIDSRTVIGGRAYINLTHETTAGSPGATMKTKVSGSRVIGSTPTELASNETPLISADPSTNYAARECVYLDIPKTIFLSGQKFRLSVLKDQLSGGALTTAIYHDPAGRLASAYGDGEHTTHSTTLTIDLPFAEQSEY